LDCYRAPLSGGGRSIDGTGGADLVGTPGLFVEAKRVERLNFLDAMRQAERNRGPLSPEKALVINRRNHMKTGDSLCLMRLDDILELYNAWCLQHGYTTRRQDCPSPEEAIN